VLGWYEPKIAAGIAGERGPLARFPFPRIPRAKFLDCVELLLSFEANVRLKLIPGVKGEDGGRDNLHRDVRSPRHSASGMLLGTITEERGVDRLQTLSALSLFE